MSLRPDEILVGHVYSAGPRSKPRKVIRKGFWWSSRYHGTVYYIGTGGREIEADENQFCKWAVSDIKQEEQSNG